MMVNWKINLIMKQLTLSKVFATYKLYNICVQEIYFYSVKSWALGRSINIVAARIILTKTFGYVI